MEAYNDINCGISVGATITLPSFPPCTDSWTAVKLYNLQENDEITLLVVLVGRRVLWRCGAMRGNTNRRERQCDSFSGANVLGLGID